MVCHINEKANILNDNDRGSILKSVASLGLVRILIAAKR